MLDIPQAFDQFRQNLELRDTEQADASRQQNVLRANLDKHLGGIARDFLSGSYARRTAIRRLHDIDLFMVLDPTAHRDVYPTTNVMPTACLKKVQAALLTAYPGAKAPIVQNRSVNVVFSTTDIGYDIVPAFANQSGVFIIPDRGRDAWIQTNPEAHRAALVAANDRAGGKLNALIKMAKQWKKEHSVALRSFHLEVMSYGAFTSAPASYPTGVRALFGHLATAVQGVCADPAGVGPNIDAGMEQSERTKAREALVTAGGEAEKALEYERAGRTPEAHRIWRWLFGSAYPEG